MAYDDIRASVRKLCEGFPGEYWRKLDREMAYPKEFVKALIDAGYLSVLIPAQYGGSGLKLSAAAAIRAEIHLSGCHGGAVHAQLYTLGVRRRAAGQGEVLGHRVGMPHRRRVHAVAWRLRRHDGVSDCPHVGRQPCATDLRRHK